MDNKILISTTNNVENATIEQYIEIISTNVVIGTNFFSDFGASITDFFGGYSDTYQNKLQEIYSVAIETLKKKAKRLGANAILGLKIDFDEISGKGKSMFMISALGTAVFLKINENKINFDNKCKNDNSISFFDLNNEVTKQIVIEKVQKNVLPSLEEWSYLLNNPIEEITEQLLNAFINLNLNYIDSLPQIEKLLFENFPIYIKNINQDFATHLLFEKIDCGSNLIYDIIKANKLFNSIKIKELVNKGLLKLAISCLKIDKQFYLENDIKEMKEIIFELENLPDLGKIEISKGLLSKSTEQYFCPKGHKNDPQDEYCQHTNRDYVLDCELNIKGISKDEINEIETFKLKIKSLEMLLIH